jgi:hypothetical protein
MSRYRDAVIKYPYAAIHADYMIAVEQCFDRLQTLDHELSDRLMAAFGGSCYAALNWLVTCKLADETPITLLSAGRRDDVLDLLARLERGVYT